MIGWMGAAMNSASPQRRLLALRLIQTLLLAGVWLWTADAHAQRRRNVDQHLFSPAHQQRMIQDFTVEPARARILREWQAVLKNRLTIRPGKEIPG